MYLHQDREVLVARAIDRAIRPLFPDGYFYETQIIANVMSSDGMQVCICFEMQL